LTAQSLPQIDSNSVIGRVRECGDIVGQIDISGGWPDVAVRAYVKRVLSRIEAFAPALGGGSGHIVAQRLIGAFRSRTSRSGRNLQ
jgi:hypothetical protein